jgi:FkbM family methyltransferase
MLRGRHLRAHLERDLAASWAAPSAYGGSGRLARTALRRVLRPMLTREAAVHALTERALREQELTARLWSLALDPPCLDDVVSAETDVGTLLLHADDEVITPMLRASGRWEPAESRWLRDRLRAGHTMVDVGANIGYFSALASRAVGPEGSVVAVEPEARNLRLLRHNLWRNGCDNVWVVPAAAVDRRGVQALRLSATNSGDHQVHPEARAGDVLVPSVALDDLLDGIPVDVVKIDTQGSDHLVVAGLERTLHASPRAVLLVEFWLDGMSDRALDPEAVLAGYRRTGRAVGLLRDDGTAGVASDDEILSAASDWEGRWVNLVLEPG